MRQVQFVLALTVCLVCGLAFGQTPGTKNDKKATRTPIGVGSEEPAKTEEPKNDEQPPSIRRPIGPEDEPKPVARPQDAAAKAISGVFVIACDSEPNKIIVLDATGKWLHTVKSVEVKFDIGHPVTITCQMYEGVLRPSRPETKSWRLAQLKTVTEADFQQMIDNLQTDPEAIRALLK
jgi:hypothetical protein